MSESIAQARAQIAAGTLTALELAESQLARIAASEGSIGAWESFDAANVKEQARRADETRREVPVFLLDLFDKMRGGELLAVFGDQAHREREGVAGLAGLFD